MFSRIFRAKSKTVGSAAILLGAASLASRVFGLVRDRLLAGTFGAGPELDAYYAAFRLPDLTYNLFVFGVISAAFIPVFARFSDEGGESDRRASALASKVMTAMGLGLTVLAFIGFVLAPAITPLIAPGFDAAGLGLTVRLTRIMFLSPVLLGLSGVLGAVLQVRKRFLIYSLAPILYNVGIIGGTLLLVPHWGVAGVAWGVVIGAFLHFSVQALACRCLDLRIALDFGFRDSGVREILRLAWPRIMSLAAGNVQMIAVTAMITALGAGGLAVYTFGQNLVYVPINMIGVSVAVAAFPFISEMAAKGRPAEMVAAINRAVRTVMFFAVPATVALLLLRAQVVRVVLGSGRFDWADTVMTADVLACLSLGLFAAALLPLLVRAFFAVHDSLTPLKVNLAVAAVGVGLAAAAVRLGYGLTGVAASLSLTNALNLAVLWVALRIRVGSLGEARIFRTVAVFSAAGLLMAAVTQAVKVVLGDLVDMQTFAGIFVQGAAAGLAGLAAYFGAAVALGSREALGAIALIRRRLAPAPAAFSQKGESIVSEQ